MLKYDHLNIVLVGFGQKARQDIDFYAHNSENNSLVLHHFSNKQQIYDTDRVNFTLLPVITCCVLVSYEPSKSFSPLQFCSTNFRITILANVHRFDDFIKRACRKKENMHITHLESINKVIDRRSKF